MDQKLFRKLRFSGSIAYWEKRYQNGGNSGTGSYNVLAEYKSNWINSFIKQNEIRKVIEFGCGDGNQLSILNVPKYLGFDVSVTALQKCIERFRTDDSKSFCLYNPLAFQNNGDISGDLVISLDVIYHVIEDLHFEKYLYHLFGASEKYVIIYAWNVDGRPDIHVKHRQFCDWIDKHIRDWRLVKINYPEKSLDGAANFYVYRKQTKQE